MRSAGVFEIQFLLEGFLWVLIACLADVLTFRCLLLKDWLASTFSIWHEAKSRISEGGHAREILWRKNA